MSDNKTRKIIVTGGAGYIGSHTVAELLANTPYEVVSIDNFSNSYPQIITQLEKISGKEVRNHPVDLCDREALERIFKAESPVDAVIHFAALKSVPESVEYPEKYYRNNLVSQLNLMEVCRENGVQAFIFSSSCSVYGNISELPVDEKTKLNRAESPYARTKQMGEDILADFTDSTPGFKAISLRYFNPVGAHQSGLIGELPLQAPTSLVPVITQTAIGIRESMQVFGDDFQTRDGSCIRDYVHVSDIARAHIDALHYALSNDVSRDVFNLGTGNGVTVLEAIRAFEKATGMELNYSVGSRRPGDVEAIYSDSAKSLEKLGWKTEYSLDDMLISAWKWQQFIVKQDWIRR